MLQSQKMKCLVLSRYRKSSIKPPWGGLFFSSTFEGGLNREGGLKRDWGLFNLAKRITCSKNTVV